ncbi:Prolyl 4-hydroxylase subunit [Dirofilaria immitis]
MHYSHSLLLVFCATFVVQACGPSQMRGPPGLRGRDGQVGEPGQKGPRGLEGAVGNKGDNGDPGHRGPPGETGAMGPKDPDHPRAKDDVKCYEDLLEDNGVRHVDMRRDIPPINNERVENDLDEGARLTYEALCRQEIPVNIKAQSHFYCYYKMDRPYLRLAPFKVEIVRENPLVVLFYDIISDEEARVIQMLALPKACLVLAFCYDTACGPSQMRGPPGLRGRDGQVGEPGQKGPRGLEGAVGNKGDNGDPGHRGPPGETGAMGPKGEVGDKGMGGIRGQDMMMGG